MWLWSGSAAYWFYHQHVETRFVAVERAAQEFQRERPRFACQRALDSVHFTVEDLERHGPGLILDLNEHDFDERDRDEPRASVRLGHLFGVLLDASSYHVMAERNRQGTVE